MPWRSARRCWSTSTPPPERKVILNLPTTVENCMPNQFADMLEYFIRRLPPGTAPSSPSTPPTMTGAPA